MMGVEACNQLVRYNFAEGLQHHRIWYHLAHTITFVQHAVSVGSGAYLISSSRDWDLSI